MIVNLYHNLMCQIRIRIRHFRRSRSFDDQGHLDSYILRHLRQLLEQSFSL